jgi:dTDP-glucose pyrophosphorylase
VLGVVPAAGAGSRLQPLAFSKEMLPVGTARDEQGVERPKAVSEYLIERMLVAGAERVCLVISPDKTDIIPYYARHPASRRFCYVVQERPSGLCDALFRALPVLQPDEDVLIGLPDTVWFPIDGYTRLSASELSFLLFQVDQPSLFDAVFTDEHGRVEDIQVKAQEPRTDWVWGAFRMPARVFRELHAVWETRQDEYVGTLINEYLRRGGRASGVRAGQVYYDVGTLQGYRAAIASLADDRRDGSPTPALRRSGTRPE